MAHIHTFTDLQGVQRVTRHPEDCDYCKVTPVAEPVVEHKSCDGYTVNVGNKFWSNDLRVVEVTEVAVHSNSYQGMATQTWHHTTEGDGNSGGDFDTLDGSLQPYGRLTRYFSGRDAEDYSAGTNYSDIKE